MAAVTLQAPANVLGNLRSLYLDTPAAPQMTARKPSVSERVQDGVANVLGKLGMGERQAHSVAKKAASFINDTTPVGAASSAEQAGNDYRGGNYLGAALNAIGAVLSAFPDGGAVAHSIIAPLFHGSPHKFEKFALEKIGTGEGAQAYGHGLYFAENPEVAREYQRQTAGDGFLTPSGQVFDPSTLQHLNVRATLTRTGDLDAAIKRAKEILPHAPDATRPLAQSDLRTLEGLKASGGIAPNTGHLYEVQLDANPEDFLNWDAPLSGQPDRVKQLLPQLVHPEVSQMRGSQIASGSLSGPGVYHAPLAMSPQGSSLPASEAWRQAGIPGIRYLDQGSRTAGQGTHNYVVFNPDIIDILGRY